MDARSGTVADMRTWFSLGCGTLLLIGISLLILRPQPINDAWRDAEQLWRAGRIAEARRAYAALPADLGPIQLRRGQIALLRGACPEAQVAAGRALQLPLRRDEAALAHLLLAECAARAGQTTIAAREWEAVDPRSPLRPLVDLLRGEAALRTGQPSAAAQHYLAALRLELSEPWRALAQTRLALSNDAAHSMLPAMPERLPSPAPDTRPFLPRTPAQIVLDARQLQAIHGRPAAERDLLLGQMALQQNLPRLALQHFERVPADDAHFVLAQAQAAYARWQIGQQLAATQQLAELHAAHPENPVVATLLATVLVSRGESAAAAAVLDTTERFQPLDPALALARAEVLAARREYARAAAELRRARDIAQAQARPRYALALANFYLTSAYRVCEDGVPAAREATVGAPEDSAGWQALAAALYHCRRFDETLAAAREGLQRQPDSPALHFYLGAAQMQTGAREAARAHLIAAADGDPAGVWRQRAEALLGWDHQNSGQP